MQKQPTKKREPQKRVFRVKAGSHSTGIIGDAENPPRYFSAADSNPFFEDPNPLHKMFPEKFELHEGPLPSATMQEQDEAYEQPAPPGPPTDFDRAQAMLASGQTTPEQARRQAQLLRERAEVMEKMADESERQARAAQPANQQSEEGDGAEARAPAMVGSPAPMKDPAAGAGDEEQQWPTDHELDKMSVEDLHGFAEERRVPGIRSNMKKAEISHTIKQHRNRSQK